MFILIRLDGDKGWNKLNVEIGFEDQHRVHEPISVPTEYFNNNNWPKFSLDLLAPQSKIPVLIHDLTH